MRPFASHIDTLQRDDITGAKFIYGVTISIPSICNIPIALPDKTSFLDLTTLSISLAL